jgi:hypothetical protein
MAAIVLDLSLPTKPTTGPPWLLPAVEALLLVGLVVTAIRSGGKPHRRRLGLIFARAVNILA